MYSIKYNENVIIFNQTYCKKIHKNVYYKSNDSKEKKKDKRRSYGRVRLERTI